MTDEQIKEIALANGFVLKYIVDGNIISQDLRPYVYRFARALLKTAFESQIESHQKMTGSQWLNRPLYDEEMSKLRNKIEQLTSENFLLENARDVSRNSAQYLINEKDALTVRITELEAEVRQLKSEREKVIRQSRRNDELLFENASLTRKLMQYELDKKESAMKETK